LCPSTPLPRLRFAPRLRPRAAHIAWLVRLRRAGCCRTGLVLHWFILPLPPRAPAQRTRWHWTSSFTVLVPARLRTSHCVLVYRLRACLVCTTVFAVRFFTHYAFAAATLVAVYCVLPLRFSYAPPDYARCRLWLPPHGLLYAAHWDAVPTALIARSFGFALPRLPRTHYAYTLFCYSFHVLLPFPVYVTFTTTFAGVPAAPPHPAVAAACYTHTATTGWLRLPHGWITRLCALHTTHAHLDYRLPHSHAFAAFYTIVLQHAHWDTLRAAVIQHTPLRLRFLHGYSLRLRFYVVATTTQFWFLPVRFGLRFTFGLLVLAVRFTFVMHSRLFGRLPRRSHTLPRFLRCAGLLLDCAVALHTALRLLRLALHFTCHCMPTHTHYTRLCTFAPFTFCLVVTAVHYSLHSYLVPYAFPTRLPPLQFDGWLVLRTALARLLLLRARLRFSSAVHHAHAVAHGSGLPAGYSCAAAPPFALHAAYPLRLLVLPYYGSCAHTTTFTHTVTTVCCPVCPQVVLPLPFCTLRSTHGLDALPRLVYPHTTHILHTLLFLYTALHCGLHMGLHGYGLRHHTHVHGLRFTRRLATHGSLVGFTFYTLYVTVWTLMVFFAPRTPLHYPRALRYCRAPQFTHAVRGSPVPRFIRFSSTVYRLVGCCPRFTLHLWFTLV